MRYAHGNQPNRLLNAEGEPAAHALLKTAASALFCLCWPSLLMFCGMRVIMLLCIIGLDLLTYLLTFGKEQQNSRKKSVLLDCDLCELLLRFLKPVGLTFVYIFLKLNLSRIFLDRAPR